MEKEINVKELSREELANWISDHLNVIKLDGDTYGKMAYVDILTETIRGMTSLIRLYNMYHSFVYYPGKSLICTSTYAFGGDITKIGTITIANRLDALHELEKKDSLCQEYKDYSSPLQNGDKVYPTVISLKKMHNAFVSIFDEIYNMIIEMDIKDWDDHYRLIKKAIKKFYNELYSTELAIEYMFIDHNKVEGKETCDVFKALRSDREVEITNYYDIGEYLIDILNSMRDDVLICTRILNKVYLQADEAIGESFGLAYTLTDTDEVNISTDNDDMFDGFDK
jgi:hypothetical protein